MKPKNLISIILLLTTTSILATPKVKAQVPFKTTCEQWVNNKLEYTFPCIVKFSSKDGYIETIKTSLDTHSRYDKGWDIGIRNKECIRSTGGGEYKIAICPVNSLAEQIPINQLWSGAKIEGSAKVCNTDGEGLNLRQKPDVTSPVIQNLSPNSKVIFNKSYGEVNQGALWVEVRYKGKKGWVGSDWLCP